MAEGPQRPAAPGGAATTREPESPIEPPAKLVGNVLFAGPVLPEATVVPVGTDPTHCGKERSLEDIVVDRETRGIRHVILHLEGPRLDGLPPAPPGRLVLDNRDCRFEPHASVLTAGSVLEVRNEDSVLHTVHAYFAASFNVALPSGGPSAERRLPRPGLVQLRCDSHGWMNAFIRVDRHALHAVTDSRGAFEIPGIPPGRYTLKVWHERLGEREAAMDLKPGEELRVQVAYDG